MTESTRDVVLRLMQDGVIRTDAELAEAARLPFNKVSGARSTLWEQGLVERIDKDEAHPRLRWRICPPERRQESQRAFRDNTETRTLSRLKTKSPGERANIVIELLSDDSVNEAVLAQLERGRAWRRARARANDVRNDREAERRARKSELRRAEREADASLVFLTQLNYLRDLIDALFVMRRFIEDEEQRTADGVPQRITVASWLSLARNVREVLEIAQVLFAEIAALVDEPMTSCPLCGERLHGTASHIDEGWIEAEAIEEDEVRSGGSSEAVST